MFGSTGKWRVKRPYGSKSVSLPEHRFVIREGAEAKVTVRMPHAAVVNAAEREAMVKELYGTVVNTDGAGGRFGDYFFLQRFLLREYVNGQGLRTGMHGVHKNKQRRHK